MVDEQQTNGNGNGSSPFSFPTFGCKGCESRKEIMGAGNWKIDAAIVLLILLGCVLFWRVKIV